VKHERNHLIRRHRVDAYPHALLGLEDLTHIRERTHTKRKHGTQASPKQRRVNRHASAWACAELPGYVAYKALLAGSMAVQVDADKTSQACHVTLDADLVGARNVTLRTLLARQDWASTGVLSERPDVSREEAKAARRQRSAELRWSLDTSPAL
jgi:putative transposase